MFVFQGELKHMVKFPLEGIEENWGGSGFVSHNGIYIDFANQLADGDGF